MHPPWPPRHQHRSFGPSPCSLQTLRTREVAERGTEIDASATTSEVPATEAARARVCGEPTLRQAILGCRTGWEVAAAVVGKVLAGGAHCGSVTQAQRAPSAHRPSADVHPFRGAPQRPLSRPDFPCPLAHIARFSPAVLAPLLTMPRPAPASPLHPSQGCKPVQPKWCQLEASTAGAQATLLHRGLGQLWQVPLQPQTRTVPHPCPAASPIVLQLPQQGFALLKRLALLGSPHVLARAGATTPAWQCGQGCALCSDGAHVVLSQLSP